MAVPTEHRFRGSTRISSGTWDEKHKRIVLTFPDGVRCRYEPVSERLWTGLIAAESAGHYLAEKLDKHFAGKVR